MIVKELDTPSGADAKAASGRAAEEQMAHYLRRAFADDPDVLIFHGLRLEADGDAAQIDHLVLHGYGLIIIESKSVTTRVRVSKQGEWSRWYGGRAQGMPSPILQAERQRDFLRACLRRDPSVLGGKEVAINVRVAISDGGLIDRPRNPEHDELDYVHKADQIPHVVREVIEMRRIASHVPMALLRLAGGTPGVMKGERLTQADLARLREFLVAHHRPGPAGGPRPTSPPAAPTPASSRPSSTVTVPRCLSCGGADLSVDRGYSDYFRCRACGRNMASASLCPRCGAKELVRRMDVGIVLDCKGCGVSRTLPIHP